MLSITNSAVQTYPVIVLQWKYWHDELASRRSNARQRIEQVEAIGKEHTRRFSLISQDPKIVCINRKRTLRKEKKKKRNEEESKKL